MAGKHRKPQARGISTPRLWLAALLLVMGLVLALYPSAAQWLSSRAHTQLLIEAQDRVHETASSEKNAALVSAMDYNKDLARGKIPVNYGDQLDLFGDGQMARVRIPSISADLPVFHGTSDDVLRRGAGHLASTSLPVGGESTHSAISAHAGLPSSALFTKLEKVQEGDEFFIEVLGEVLVYRVTEIKIVKPDEAESLSISRGKDLVTLITCTPIGINTDRILVTGERVISDLKEDVQVEPIEPVGFPYWIIFGAGGSVLIIGGTIFMAAKRRKPC